MNKIHCFIALFFYFGLATTLAQKKVNDPIINKIERYSTTHPKEQLYLSFDKSYYVAGDTIWYKTTLLNANYGLNPWSDRVYIELLNESDILVERKVTPLKNGLGYGDFSLPTTLSDGRYTIRAYTNWQQNFGSDYFFEKSIYLGNTLKKTWLITASEKLIPAGPNLNIEVKAKIEGINREKIGYKDLKINLLNNKKKILQTELQTSMDGLFDVVVPLNADKIQGTYSLKVTDKNDNTFNATIPLSLASSDEVDLQFMPEGGYLVTDIYSKVAFKAIGKDGLGKEITGKIIDGKGDEVTSFSSFHNGMGTFSLLPKKEEMYYAFYEIGGKKSQLKLPPAKTQGTTLRIDHLSKIDTILVAVRASEAKRTPSNYQLIAQYGDSIVLALNLDLTSGFTNLKLPKDIFPDGIIHFTLFDPDDLPVNERNVFINNRKKLDLQVGTQTVKFSSKDSVALEVTALDENGSPIIGSFSIAVTDDRLVAQTEQHDNIISHYLLQSKLKGNIEKASWYFQQQDPKKRMALDNLLLTQSWVGYQWDEILNQKSPFPLFRQEKDNSVSGKLTNIFNKPVANINVTLVSVGKSLLATDTISNSDGKFSFANLPLVDSAAYTLKIRNAKGKTSAATISVDEFVPTNNPPRAAQIQPWYINADSTSLNYFKNTQELIKKDEKNKHILTGNALNEVEIIGNKKEQAFKQKAAWDASFFKKIDEAELKKTPQKSLLQLLKEKFPTFNTGNTWADGCFGRNSAVRYHPFVNFLIGNALISHVVVDNINTHLVSCGVDDNYNFDIRAISQTAIEPNVYFTNQNIFDSFNAADIKEINLYKGCAYYFLEITTRSGKGPWTQLPNGTYVHRPLPLYFGKEFYQPKYKVSTTSEIDAKATIFWNANIVTDDNGKAKVWFYLPKTTQSYSVKIEGTDMFGRFGFKKTTAKTNNQTASK